MKPLLFIPIFLLLLTTVVFSQSVTVFSGMPTIKISEGGIERFPEKLERKNAVNLKCVISKIGEKYYCKQRKQRNVS
jgi:hypothetical protein